MSEVHKAISAHSAKQHEHIKTFMQLEHLREMAIEEAVAKCKNDEPFSTDAINEITEKMNQLAKEKASYRLDVWYQKKWSTNTSAAHKLDDPASSADPPLRAYYMYPT